MRLPTLVLLTTTAFAQSAPLVIAHRGGKLLRPENTLAAFRYATAIGSDIIELDVVATSDDRLVVHHDTSINPANCFVPGQAAPSDRPFIRTFMFEAAQRYDCGSRRPGGFTHWQPAPGARIPALEEVLERFQGRPVRLLIEMKMAPDDTEGFIRPDHFARLLHDTIKKYGVGDQVIVQSGDYRTLRELRKLSPDIPLCQLSLWRQADDWVRAAKDFGGGYQLVTNTALTPEAVRELQAYGIAVFSSTANDAIEWKRLLALGVDGILTDNPYGLIRYLKERGLRR